MAPLDVQVFWVLERGDNARKNDDHSGSMGWGKISRWLKLPYIQQDDFLQKDRVILKALLFLLRPIKGGKETGCEF